MMECGQALRASMSVEMDSDTRCRRLEGGSIKELTNTRLRGKLRGKGRPPNATADRLLDPLPQVWTRGPTVKATYDAVITREPLSSYPVACHRLASSKHSNKVI